ncbi:MAG: hypothetical protein EPN48_16915 [Microbacteriaceae bacterium]|nr:MAG: hypothetical protein EPN48_16915 [Microbacteriaceae bacterium]
MRIVFALLRATAGIAIIAAIMAQLTASIAFWQGSGIADLTTQITNYFSFFTIDSNALAAIVLVVGAVILATGRGADPKWFTLVRASAVTYMVVTGIVYNLLLRGIELPQGVTVQWSNEILHVIAPAYLLFDWLFAPGRSPVRRNALLKILVFPLVWVAYTMLRAPVTDDPIHHQSYWYPYPFLNPHNSPEGFLSVAFYIVLIAAVIGLAGAGVGWLSRHWTTRSRRSRA